MKKLFAILVAGAAIFSFAACSTEAAEKSDIDFWSAFKVESLEVSPPENLSQLVEQSDLVVTGKIIGVSEGPVEEGGYDQYTPIAQLDVQVDEVVLGTLATDTVKVVVARLEHATLEELAQNIPTETVTMFLSPVSFGDYYSSSANVGIVAESPSGELEAVQEPGRSAVITSEARTESELVEAVKELSAQ